MFSQGAADVPCTLLHFVNDELVDVAKGKIVQPGNPLFHGTQMPPNLFRVQLVRVLPGCDEVLPPIQPMGADDDDVMNLSACLSWPLLWPKSQITKVPSTLLRLSPRRKSSCSTKGLRRAASPAAPPQDLRMGRLPPSHRKARPAPSSSRARGLSSRGPSTLLRLRGRRLGTTWRRVLKHVSLEKEQGKEIQSLKSSSARPFRSYSGQES